MIWGLTWSGARYNLVELVHDGAVRDFDPPYLTFFRGVKDDYGEESSPVVPDLGEVPEKTIHGGEENL